MINLTRAVTITCVLISKNWFWNLKLRIFHFFEWLIDQGKKFWFCSIMHKNENLEIIILILKCEAKGGEYYYKGEKSKTWYWGIRREPRLAVSSNFKILERNAVWVKSFW